VIFFLSFSNSYSLSNKEGDNISIGTNDASPLINSIENQTENPFYIIATGAVKTEAEAKIAVEKLIKEGYKAGYLWIPDYESLSGTPMFAIYIGPFAEQSQCERL